MKVLGYGLGWLLVGALTLVFKGFVLSMKATGWVLAPLAQRALRRFAPKQRASQPKQPETVAVKVDTSVLAAPEPVRDTGPETVMVENEFNAADDIVTLRLDPPVGVIHLRVFRAAGIVKRDVVISDPCLSALMKGRRHNFPDAPYYRMYGLEGIKDDTVALTEALINSFTNPGGVAETTVKAQEQRADTLAPVVARQTPAQEEARPAAPPAPAEHKAPAPAEHKPPPHNAKVVAPRVSEGFTYVGKLVKAGSQRYAPRGREPYEVFEATLALDNGAELSLRGAELARELTGAHCEVGNRVAITPMGKVPVTLSNGSEGSKNLYRVQRMGVAKG